MPRWRLGGHCVHSGRRRISFLWVYLSHGSVSILARSRLPRPRKPSRRTKRPCTRCIGEADRTTTGTARCRSESWSLSTHFPEIFEHDGATMRFGVIHDFLGHDVILMFGYARLLTLEFGKQSPSPLFLKIPCRMYADWSVFEPSLLPASGFGPCHCATYLW